MKVTTERIENSQVLLNIEIDSERVERSMDQAYKRIANRARIPGFRPGKAPRAIVERHVGREAVLQEALDRLVPDIVFEAIEQESVDAIDQPALTIKSLDPVVVEARVPVRPTVELGDYRNLRVEEEPDTVDPDEIEKQIESLRKRYATVEPVERAAAEGDRVRLDLWIKDNEGNSYSGDDEDEDHEEELSVTEADLAFYPGLYPELLGVSAGDEKSFDYAVPEDVDHPAAGGTLSYKLVVKDVKAEVLPEVDDDFAQGVGEGFPTVAALREHLENGLRERAEQDRQRKFDETAFEKLMETATVEFPPQMVDREVHRLLHDQGIPADDPKQLDRLLRSAGRTQEQLLEIFRPAAEDRVRRALVLRRFTELEGITVSKEDIDAELEKMLETVNEDDREQMRGLFDTENGRDVMERQLRSNRAVERLRAIARGENPPLPELPADSDATTAASDAPATTEETVTASAEATPADAGDQPATAS